MRGQAYVFIGSLNTPVGCLMLTTSLRREICFGRFCHCPASNDEQSDFAENERLTYSSGWKYSGQKTL
jgi:hypothetical protein